MKTLSHIDEKIKKAGKGLIFVENFLELMYIVKEIIVILHKYKNTLRKEAPGLNCMYLEKLKSAMSGGMSGESMYKCENMR